MKIRYFFVFLFFFFIIVSLILLNPGITGNVVGGHGIYENPDKVISKLHTAIELAEENGEYKCCIEPACTMCYLGKWKFEKGTCYCDDAIAEGRNEDVCPECKKGMEQGLCESIEKCEI